MLPNQNLEEVDWGKYEMGELEICFTDGSYGRAKIISLQLVDGVLGMKLGPPMEKPFTMTGSVPWMRGKNDGSEEKIVLSNVLFGSETKHIRLWAQGDYISYRFFEPRDPENIFPV